MKTAIYFSFAFLTVFGTSILIQHVSLALLLVLLAPIPLIWLVISTLKDKNAPDKTFHTHFYQDWEYERNHQ